jgi:hypothetical protein
MTFVLGVFPRQNFHCWTHPEPYQFHVCCCSNQFNSVMPCCVFRYLTNGGAIRHLYTPQHRPCVQLVPMLGNTGLRIRLPMWWQPGVATRGGNYRIISGQWTRACILGKLKPACGLVHVSKYHFNRSIRCIDFSIHSSVSESWL